MRQFNCVLILVFSLLMSCNKSNKISIQIPQFDLIDISKTSKVKLSELGVIGIQYIPLETNSSNLIFRIKKIEANNNSFFIADRYKISKYAMDGSYINDIGTRGRGPNEYSIVLDFSIDSKNGQIFILNGTRRNGKIYIYSLNGSFIKSLSSPNYALNLACVEDGLLCYLPDMDGIIDTSFVLIDYNGKTKKKYPNKFPCHRKVHMPTGFLVDFLYYKYKNQLFIKENYSDTIFAFDNLSFKPAYILNHGKKTLSPALREQINSFEDFIQITSRICIVTSLFETNNFIYSEFIDEERLYAFVSFRDVDSYFLLNAEKGITNDIDGGPNINFKTAKDENTVISWINAFELKAHVASEAFKNSTPKYPEKKRELEKLANNLKENDNPVLMLVKLKKK
jgi:hypothetical protein